MYLVDALPGLFSIIVAAAGWYYIFYSRAASNLASVEATQTNQLRVRLRRVGGGAMILLAISFYVGVVEIDRHRAPLAIVCMGLVLLFMVVIVALGLFDLRLTRRIREAQEKEDHQ